MTFLAQRLPIALVPEQCFIASVRDDVVDHGRRCHMPFSFAFRTKRVHLQKSLPSCLPPFGISPGSSAFPGIQSTVLFTVYTVRQVQTPRMSARTLRFSRHVFSLNEKETPPIIYGAPSLMLHRPVERHHQRNRTVNLLRGFLLVDFQIAGRIGTHIRIVHVPA